MTTITVLSIALALSIGFIFGMLVEKIFNVKSSNKKQEESSAPEGLPNPFSMKIHPPEDFYARVNEERERREKFVRLRQQYQVKKYLQNTDTEDLFMTPPPTAGLGAIMGFGFDDEEESNVSVIPFQKMRRRQSKQEYTNNVIAVDFSKKKNG